MVKFETAKEIFYTPFFELIYKAYTIHKENFDASKIQACSLLSIQTGGCSEDCAWCAQSSRNKTKMPKQIITDLKTILDAAQKAKEIGSSRFCMGSSGRMPNREFFEMICKVVKEVKKLGLETCLTMGTLTEDQVKTLKDCGLDYYNHNIESSPEYYKNIVTTRTMDEKINTINLVQKYDINVCSGGIIGMGETNEDRIKMFVLLANLKKPPASIPINRLIKIPGTPLENAPDVDTFDFVRSIALARILMPKSFVRLSAGRETMSEELQALCFFAGANSIFVGEKLLTVRNSDYQKDFELLKKLNMSLL
ncbi:MAG: biotin synthase BioB [Holosporales bacterium]|jgi:biotin synthase|nr:biotin synthase BioB [Holosporales bacterium]